MKYTRLIIFLILPLLFSTCGSQDELNDLHSVYKEEIEGLIQKGPFINGTTITIAELNAKLSQTGKLFFTEITDNSGNFKIEDVQLSSQYVELKATGFYFNEMLGKNSTAQLTLGAYTDLSDKSNINVNIMSHLEKNRIKYLISQGYSFSKAKEQAQSEILDIFSMSKKDMPESELLDISKEGDYNAKLLAISVIILGYNSDAAVSELMANISTDISEDGVMDDQSLGSQLINNAILLNLPAIRQNLENRYSELGVEATIPDFETYVEQFIENTEYEFTSLIAYPQFSNYGENILFNGIDTLIANKSYSLAAGLAENTSLKIVMSGGLWWYRFMPEGPVNWQISTYDFNSQSQIFTSEVPGLDCDLSLEFDPATRQVEDTIHTAEGDSIFGEWVYENDYILVKFYENLSEEPTMTKTLVIVPAR